MMYISVLSVLVAVSTLVCLCNGVVIPEEGFQRWMGTTFAFELVDIKDLDELRDGETVLKDVAKDLDQVGLAVDRKASFADWNHSQGDADQDVKKEKHAEGNVKDLEGSQFVMLYLENGGHVSMAIQPELSYAALDIFIAADVDETLVLEAVKTIAASFKAVVKEGHRVPRGIPSRATVNADVLAPEDTIVQFEHELEQSENVGDIDPQKINQQWARHLPRRDLELVNPDFNTDYDVIYEEKSPYQFIEILKHKRTGDICLFLDLLIQICESFDAAYSEVYVHLPIAFLDKVETVLIVGGGDALALREVLEYSSVKRVVQLELDIRVPKTCEKYFGVNAHLPDNPDADPRVEWVFGDAAVTVKNLIDKGERFDVILMDISETDPSKGVSSEDFFRKISAALSPNGIFIKNDQNYQRPTARLFKEFLEVAYPVPVIIEQTFVLGSNGTSLFPLPSFITLEENAINTTFLAHGPSTDFRQLRGMVRSYYSHTEEEIGQETIGSIAQSNWKGTHNPHDLRAARLEVTLTNLSPMECDLFSIDPTTQQETSVLTEVALSETRRFTAEIDDEFILKDSEKLDITLARFKITSQHLTHPHISFQGLHRELMADEEPILGNIPQN